MKIEKYFFRFFMIICIFFSCKYKIGNKNEEKLYHEKRKIIKNIKAINKKAKPKIKGIRNIKIDKGEIKKLKKNDKINYHEDKLKTTIQSKKHLFDCQAMSFINFIYKNLNNLIFFDNIKKSKIKNIKQRTNRFVNGVFIFEDNNGEIFKILCGDKPKKCSNYIAIRTTHSSVIKKIKKQKETDIKLYNFEKNSWDNPSFGRGLRFYEVAFNKKIKIYYNIFDNNEKKLKFDEKGVAIISRFKITKKNLKGKLEEKRYTFLKLERNKTISMTHVYRAAKRYSFFGKVKSSFLISRRENSKKQINSSKEDYHISEYINTIDDKTKIKQIKYNCKFYDYYVRTGNEFFIPKSMTDIIKNKFYNSKI